MHEPQGSDREAILLRYFENRQFAEIGGKFGLNEKRRADAGGTRAGKNCGRFFCDEASRPRPRWRP